MSTTEAIPERSPKIAPPSAPVASTAAVISNKTWLIGPWLDALLISNAHWPLLLAAILAWPSFLTGSGTSGAGPISILQLYFISSPHRWITLVLVFCDPERFRQDSRRFIGYGSGLILFGLCLAGLGYLSVSSDLSDSNAMDPLIASLSLFMMVDFVCNAWHFAAQHAGIGAIYRRVGRVQQTERQISFEMSSLRVMVLWTFLRIGLAASTSSFRLPWIANVQPVLVVLDFAFLIPAALVALKVLATGGLQRSGRSLYLFSVVTLYAAILTSIQLQHYRWMTGLLVCQAMFHATEYLAVVYWSVQNRRSGIWKFHVARGVLGVAVFIGVIGIGNWAIDRNHAYAWALITLLVSLLHYAYDGIIWKSKRKPSATTPAAPASQTA